MDEQTSVNALRPLAVLIGITDYRNPRLELRTPVTDVKRLASVLEAEHGYECRLLLDSEATKYGLLRLLQDELPAVVSEERRVLIYFAGHGIALDSVEDVDGYLVPADGDDALDSLISMDEVSKALHSLNCRHLVLMLDCCFAGAFRWSASRNVVPPAPPRMYRERYELYMRAPAWQVITSAAHDERAADLIAGMPIGQRDQEHSPFCDALLRGLAGAADLFPRGNEDGSSGDGIVTATELYLYLRGELEPHARQTPGLWALKKHHKGEYIFHVPRRELRLPTAPELTGDNSPYRGFEPYYEEHASLLFGRDEETQALKERVESLALTLVVGPSGTGKSSIVRAGLIPLLRREHPDWNILAPFRPGCTPQATLQNTFDVGSYTDKATVVLIVDQLEEIFTLGILPRERDAFLSELAAVARDPRVKLVCTMRVDLEAHLWAGPLGEDWARARFALSDMTQDKLREAIEMPAEESVLVFQPPTLVDDLVNAVVSMPGALPLLSFTLSQLYQRSIERGTGDRVLSIDDYQAIGGVEGALQRRLSDIHDGFDEATRQTMRRVLLRMVTIKGGAITRRQVPLWELDFDDAGENERVHAVLDTLTSAGARLVVYDTSDVGPCVEPAHDAVVRGWKQLKQWLEWQGEYENLLLDRAITSAAMDWQTAWRHRRSLWHNDPRLALVRRSVASTSHRLNRLEKQFIDQSQRARRIRILAIALIISAMMAALGIAAVSSFNGARSERAAREQAENQALANAAYSLAERDPTIALQFAEKAYAKDQGATAVLALLKAFNTGSWLYSHRFDGAVDADLSSDGRVLAWIDKELRLNIVELPGRQSKILPIKGYHQVRFLPSGNLVAWYWDGRETVGELIIANVDGKILNKHTSGFFRPIICDSGTIMVPSATDKRELIVYIVEENVQAERSFWLPSEIDDLWLTAGCLPKAAGLVVAQTSPPLVVVVDRDGNARVLDVPASYHPVDLAIDTHHLRAAVYLAGAVVNETDAIGWVGLDADNNDVAGLAIIRLPMSSGFDSGGKLRFLADGRVVAASTDGWTRVVDLPNASSESIEVRYRATDRIASNHNNDVIAFARRSGVVSLFTPAGVPIGRLLGEPASDGGNPAFDHLAFDDTGEMLLTVSRAGARLWHRPRYRLTFPIDFDQIDKLPDDVARFFRAFQRSDERGSVSTCNDRESLQIDNDGDVRLCVQTSTRVDFLSAGLTRDNFRVLMSGDVDAIGHHFISDNASRLFVLLPGMIHRIVLQERRDGRLWEPDPETWRAWMN